MSTKKERLVWISGGIMIIGLAALAVSCAGFIKPAAPPPPVAVISPPLIPHSLEGRADCLLCHEKGIGGAPQFPASHIGRPSDVCRTCHIAASGTNGGPLPTTPVPSPKTTSTPSPGTTPVAISGKELYSAKCAACHGANRQGTPGLAPELTSEEIAERSDAQIRDAISEGIAGTAMPGFKGSLSPAEIDALLQFLKSP